MGILSIVTMVWEPACVDQHIEKDKGGAQGMIVGAERCALSARKRGFNCAEGDHFS
jgi:hypothetical protein